jgi:hypothetical protein
MHIATVIVRILIMVEENAELVMHHNAYLKISYDVMYQIKTTQLWWHPCLENEWF